MELEELWSRIPAALFEMTNELIRRGSECFDENDTSQQSACFLLGVRAVSLLYGMAETLKPDTYDTWDVLGRAFMECRDLMTTFRFDDENTREHVRLWFAQKGKDSWQPKHKACETFLASVGAGDLELARRWGLFSGLSHPTVTAARNSVAIIGARTGQGQPGDPRVLIEKKADYITDVVSLFVVSSYELPGWIDLGFDVSRTSVAERLRSDAPAVVSPILQSKSQAQ